ncbi:ABC-2 family transporter protein (macronuclear) [Tetrahymena thermophila SB210]|uniref:ABC-2 family transporter protein n=1 Tax=Tetrahymena thermophila (strain SB210) TaxID=312017 RepID=W7X913_TETTS|nr:ABC-2 family transporter protein [Tetrahymena thermophila SB210]EWS75885.1 ABC-2 family transporter protein [Tetrahymena thermophila SB210]|eukprot:XP_012651588.1 ABC-2 family transporter protein [Tetrahymena thermophila SB210]
MSDNLINNTKRQAVDIVFKNIDYSVKNKKHTRQILKGVSGICKNSQINAILGTSGAGKTTLLNILCQRIQNKPDQILSGKVLANNLPYTSNQFTQFASYVMQDDILLEALTVKECLQFAVNLKTVGNQQQKTQKVEEIIKILKLERCQNTFIGGNFIKGISGGEKKRTSIGYELISDPQCLFLDEPTSGLDSFTAYCIIDFLRKYAHNQNKTVVFTIHQPSSDIWNMFDNVMLMVEGQFIYQGTGGMNVLNYFSSIGFKCPVYSNPADFLMSIMTPEREINVKNYDFYFLQYASNLKENVEANIKNSIEEEMQVDSIKTNFRTNMFYQTTQIALRQVKILKRNPILLAARVIQSVVISFFIGLIYWQTPGPTDNPTQRDIDSKNGLLYFQVIGAFMMALKPCILTFPSERAVFLREENSQLYTVGPYFLGKYIVDILPCIISPILSSIVVYWMVGLNTDSPGKVLFFMFTSALQGLSGIALGYLGGCAFKNAHIAVAISPAITVPTMLFGGYYKNSGDYASWIGWISYLSPYKYSFSALAQNEYTYEGQNYPQDPIKQLNFNLDKWESIGCLIGLCLGYSIIAYILLSLLKKKLQ